MSSAEVQIIFQCPRCKNNRMGLLVRTEEGLATAGIAFPMGSGEDGEPLASKFREDEAVLCHQCMLEDAQKAVAGSSDRTEG